MELFGWGLIINAVAIVAALWQTYSMIKTRTVIIETKLEMMSKVLEKIEQRIWDTRGKSENEMPHMQ